MALIAIVSLPLLAAFLCWIRSYGEQLGLSA